MPFIVRWPNKVAADSTSTRMVCLTDCFATLGNLVEQPLAPEDAVDSFNFLDALLQKTAVSVESDGDANQRTTSLESVTAEPVLHPAIPDHVLTTPIQMLDFAKGIGLDAMTDAIDAKVIRLQGLSMN